MNRDVIPVAELNLPFTTVGKFSWELDPNEVVQISRKSCSDTPNFHIQLGRKGDDTVPLTSTPQIVDPVNVPLPESPGVSWESKNIHKSSSQLEVINKQPSSFTSPISIDDKPVNHSNTAFATDVVLDLNVLFSNVNAGDISAPALIEANPIVPVPVAQNLHGIDVGVGTVPQTQPVAVRYCEPHRLSHLEEASLHPGLYKRLRAVVVRVFSYCSDGGGSMWDLAIRRLSGSRVR